MIGSTSKWSRAGLLAASIIAVLPLLQAGAAERVGQIHERGTRTRALAEDPARSILTAGASSRVCESGAKWLRIDFRSLKLRGYDSLVLRSSEGDRQVFQGAQWNQRSFASRALRGSCVDIQPYFADRDSSYRLSSVTSGMRALSQTSVVVAGAGDLCDNTLTCKATSDLIVNMNPDQVFTAGDNAYEDGTLNEYQSYYDPSWGRFKTKTKPTPGNHEYQTTGAEGYFAYYTEAVAGKRGEGYYSWDVGDWRFIALNTMSGAAISPTGAQVTWLKQTLAANPKPCTAAYFHHPLISVGNYYRRNNDGDYSYKEVKPLYDALYAAGVDLVLVGHDHNYQRYVKMNPSLQADPKGFVQVLVGTGGRGFYGIPTANRSNPLLAKRPNSTDPAVSASTYGVLKLTLTSTGYTGEFVRATNANNGDFGSATRPENFSGTCNKAVTGTTYAISGAVTTSTGAAIPNVAISNGSATVTTNASGQYSFAGLANGTYTLTPSLSGYSFSPDRTIVTVSGANVVGRNFTGTASSASTQLLINPGFESGNTVWTASTGVIDGSANANPYSGTWVAWLRDYGTAGTDTLTQSVSIPPGRTSATLSFWLRISTEETTTTLQNDTMRVQVLDSAGALLATCATYSNLTTPQRQYAQRSCNLTPYIGRTVRIRFTATENGSLRTGFRVDDTALIVN